MKKRILLILHLPPPVHGAALMGSYIMNSKKINENFECDYINLSASKSIATIGKLSSRKTFFLITLILTTFKRLASKKYDACYITPTSKGKAFYKDLIILTVLKLFRKKILLHFHNKGVAEKTASSRLNHALYKFALGGEKTKIILVSKLLYPDIKDYVPLHRVFYCPNGIPDIDIESSYKKPEGKVRLLFLSNMMVNKGVFVLLEACLILKKNKLDFECHFVGDWLDISEKEFYQQVADLDLKNNVYAHGKKYDSAKNIHLYQSDIFVLPSTDEAFGLVLLEAMQFELPIVATDEGGIPEVVTDLKTGFIVPRNDAAALANRLMELINAPQLRTEMGSAGKKRFEEHFTLEKFETRLLLILNKVTSVI